MYRYKRLKCLGEGGFGKAILVCDRENRSKQYVAKEVRLSHLSQKDIDDARREASFLKGLNHSNVIKYVTLKIALLLLVMEAIQCPPPFRLTYRITRML